jgi:flavin-dependent dehydrogenase
VDVLVAGAGPAGSLAACLASRAGASVLVVERAAFPRWKVCGACLNGAARGVLRGAGLHGIAEMGHPLDALAVEGWGRRATLPVNGSVALTRAAMDTALLAAAREAGAAFVSGTVEGLGVLEGSGAGDERRVVSVRTETGVRRIAARVVVDAAGLNGLRADTPADAPRVADDARIGVGAVYPAVTPGWEAGTIHMVAGDHGYVGLVRTEDGALNVAGALDPDFVRQSGGPGPAVAAHLRAAGRPGLPGAPLHGWKGTPMLTRRPAELAGPRWLRVGDAAGYVEPFTGEGMAWALGAAAAAAPLVVAGVRAWSPGLESRWRAVHREQVGARQRLCRGVAWLSRRPGLARSGLALLRAAPWIAAPLTRHTAHPFPNPTRMPVLTQGVAT